MEDAQSTNLPCIKEGGSLCSVDRNNIMPRKRKVQFPCIVCEKAARCGTIQCDLCSMWVHKHCVPLTSEQFADYVNSDNYLDINKCQVMSFGRHIDNTCIYNVLDHNNCMIPLARVDKVKDLGVWLDEQLSFKEHMHDKINKAYSMLGIIKRNFKYLTIRTFILLYKNMVPSPK